MALAQPNGQGIKAAETTWLEDVIQFEYKELPDGGKILLFTLSNLHKYAVPLMGSLLQGVQKAVSPVILPTGPINGSGLRG